MCPAVPSKPKMSKGCSSTSADADWVWSEVLLTSPLVKGRRRWRGGIKVSGGVWWNRLGRRSVLSLSFLLVWTNEGYNARALPHTSDDVVIGVDEERRE